jgi:hypothetical protein
VLRVHFQGWFQCRLATDPDPTDEPRGASGFNFALAGEPDLDRILRLHDPVAQRSHGPPIGVFVSAVDVAHARAPAHPLLGARVSLLGEPRIESRNYVAADGSAGPIVPFHLEIAGAGITVRREDFLYPADPSLELHELPPVCLRRRGSLIRMSLDPLRVADTAGITDPVAYRRERRAQLATDLEREGDPTARAALEKRLRELAITDPEKLQVAALSLYNDYWFEINGPSEVTDPHGALGTSLDRGRDWPITFWMGGWDADSLSGYLRGMLTIPRIGDGALAGEASTPRTWQGDRPDERT